MKRLLVIGAIACLTVSSTISAQGDYRASAQVDPRVGQRADQVKRATLRLADAALLDITRGNSNSRGDIQAALSAQQIDASATLLVEMVRARRPIQELREVASELSEMTRLAPSFSVQAGLWRNVQSAVTDLNRDVFNNQPGPYPGPPERPIVGRVSWRGTVDDRVHLVIRGRSIETRVVSGQPHGEGVAVFTSPLPNNNVDVDVTKQGGRGSVKVLQQPSRTNDFTAVIEIYDSPGGSQEYRLDIVWR